MIPKLYPLLLHRTFFSFSIVCYKKLTPLAQRHAVLSKKIRSTININDTIQVIQSNLPQVQEIGKTIILECLNQFYMDPRQAIITQKYYKLHFLINKLEGLTLYELIIKLSVLQKISGYFADLKINQQYQQTVQICINHILDIVSSKQVDILECLNFFMIFRLHKYQKLFLKVLSIFNQKIIKYYEYDFNMLNTFGIVINQIAYIDWSKLRKFQNIIEYFTEHFHLQSHNRGQNELPIKNLCKLQLHKIGLKRIPVYLKQVVQLLKPQVEKLPLHLVCSLITSISTLPATFHSQFQTALMKRLYEDQKSPITCYTCFPYRGLSSSDINHFYGKEENCSYLWNQIVYHADPQRLKYFFRGAILSYFEQMINRKENALNKVDKSQKTSSNTSRYCYLAYYYYYYKDSKEMLQKIKKILLQHFSYLGIEKAIAQFSIVNFITALILFEDNPVILKQMKQKFQIETNKRKTKLRFNNYISHILLAIELHIENQSQIGKQILKQFMNQLLSDNQDKFNMQEDGKLLLILMNNKQIPQYTTIKEKLWNKFPKEELLCFTQYFLVYENKTFKGTQQLIKKLIQSSIPVMQMIKFISSINIKYLQNKRGRLETNLDTYFKNNLQKIKPNLKFLNEINRIIGMLLNYNTNGQFVKNLYLETLEVVEKYVREYNVEEKHTSHRLIIEFLFRFEQIMGNKQLKIGNNIIILQKINGILKILMKGDDKLFMKAKFLQFYYFYKQYVKIPEGTQIDIIHELQQAFKKSKYPIQMMDIAYILLELHCFGFVKLEKKEETQHMAIVSQAIIQGKFSIYQVRKYIVSTLYHMNNQRILNSQNNLFKKILSPLFIDTLRVSNQDNHFHIVKPFIKYFKKVKQLQKIQQYCLKILQNYITPEVIQFFTLNYPINRISTKLLDQFVNKLHKQSIQNLFNHNIVNVLYFFECIFFETPGKYKQFIEMLWTYANKIMKQQITKVKENTLNKNEENYVLGRYPLYMFCCIKAGKVQNNKMFEYLAQFIQKDPKYFNSKIQQNELLKGINLNILKYIYIEKIRKSHHQTMSLFNNQAVQIGNLSIFSVTLNKLLAEQNTPYKFKWILNGCIVQYYLLETKQVIMVIKHKKENDLDMGIELNGIQRFQYEVAKYLLPEYKIRIYEDYNKKFINI